MRRAPPRYACPVAELGLAIFLVGALLLIDRDRVEWVAGKVRELIDWFSS